MRGLPLLEGMRFMERGSRSEAADEGEEAAEVLAGRLEALRSVRELAVWLDGRAQLGVDAFARGGPEVLVAVDRSGVSADLGGLMRGYAAARRRATAVVPYRPRRGPSFSIQDALERLGRMLGLSSVGMGARHWMSLEVFWPMSASRGVERRGA